MTVFNKNLTEERWFQLSFFEQMAHIGSEISRTMQWRGNDPERSNAAFDNALELLDLTIIDPKNKTRPILKELCRLREVLVDYFFCDNIYGSTEKVWRDYFDGFAYKAAIQHEIKSST